MRPVELLVFGIVYRVLSKHVQGSTSFSIVQFSRSCADRFSRTAYLLYLIEFRLSRTFFETFFELSDRPAGAVPKACRRRYSLSILPHSKRFVKHFFEIFCRSPSDPVEAAPRQLSLLQSGASLVIPVFCPFEGPCRSRQLDYNTASKAECQYLFDKFFLYFLCIPYMVHSLVSGHKI